MKLRAPVVVPLFTFCVVSLLGASDARLPTVPVSQSPSSSNKPAAWDRQAAAKYLDDRMDLWFAKASKLQTGEGKTSCVSCHTTVTSELGDHWLCIALPKTPMATKLQLTPGSGSSKQDAGQKVRQAYERSAVKWKPV